MAITRYNKARKLKSLLGMKANEYPVKTSPKKR